MIMRMYDFLLILHMGKFVSSGTTFGILSRTNYWKSLDSTE